MTGAIHAAEPMDSSSLPYLLAGAALYCSGLLAAISPGHALRRLLGINIMGSGVFMVIVATAAEGAPVMAWLPRSLVLAGLLVAFGLSAVAVALLLRLQRERAKES